MGVRRVRVSEVMIERVLSGELFGGHVVTDIPGDARVVQLFTTAYGPDVLTFAILESEAWESLPQGAVIPEVDVVFTIRPLLSKKQSDAIHDAYTTLSALYSAYGRSDETVGNLAATSASLLVSAFPSCALLEQGIDRDREQRP